jgi:hypothetical protein
VGHTQHGNIHIVGNNNNVIANCDVLGDIVIEGVNNTLIANHMAGTIQLSAATNQVCDGNLQLNDVNRDKVFETGEAGALLSCSN